MSNKNYGGAAFPSAGVVLDHSRNERQQGAYEGMTLRDYFAASALSGILARPTGTKDSQAAARCAFEIADAMLAERAK